MAKKVNWGVRLAGFILGNLKKEKIMWQRLAVLLFLLLSFSLAQAATTPTSDFTDNGDGTVYHKTTGLIWKRCAEGQTWTGSTCSGSAKGYTWADAMGLCPSGWGMPTKEQLRTIVDTSSYPTINTTIFPNTPAFSFWSASADAGNSDFAWLVSFYRGYDYYSYPKTLPVPVRLVRSGQCLGSSSTPVNNPPTSPSFLSVPSSVAVNVPVTITVQAGTDPEGEQVNANCSAPNSDHPDSASASTSDMGSGGRSVYHTFTFYTSGTQYIYCTSFDASHNASSTVSQPIYVTAQSSNRSPVATISASPTSGYAPLSGTLDASSSYDPDGSIASYAWSDSTGAGSSGKYASFKFTSPGTYTVWLTVTDDKGATGSAQQTITVSQNPYNPPVASFTAGSDSGDAPFFVLLNANLSHGTDGNIINYAWTTSDGQKSSSDRSKTASFTFTKPGTYTITLTVTDDLGSTDSISKTITVNTANQRPSASFSVSPASGTAPLTVSLDASASSDSDGSVASYAWSSSDGQSASGKTASLVFSQAGSYTVTLKVTDDKGATGGVAKTVTVAAASTPLSAPIVNHKVSKNVVTISWNAMPDAKSYMFYYAPADSAGRPGGKINPMPLPAAQTTLTTGTPLPAGFEGYYAVSACRNTDATGCGTLSNLGYIYLPPSSKSKVRVWNEQSASFFSARKAVLDGGYYKNTQNEVMLAVTKNMLEMAQTIHTIEGSTDPAKMISSVICSDGASFLFDNMYQSAFGDDSLTTLSATVVKNVVCSAVIPCVVGSVAECSASVITTLADAGKTFMTEKSSASYGRDLMEGILAQEYLNIWYRFDESNAAVNQYLSIPSNASTTDAVAAIAGKYGASQSTFINFLFASTYRPQKVDELITINRGYVDKALSSYW